MKYLVLGRGVVRIGRFFLLLGIGKIGDSTLQLDMIEW